jgi:hypothetical protein
VSVVTKNRCKRLMHLDQNGTLEGVWFPNARRVVTNPAGVEQAATGSVVGTYGRWEALTAISVPGYQPGPQTRECQRAVRVSEAA